jgi:hypothetical protein
LYAGVKLYDGFAYSRSFITREGFFDVFLEPLVEDLLNLWKGVSAYDANTGKMFKLHAAVLWCIHDYPALSTLSGRTTKGYYACTHCDKRPIPSCL